MIEFVLVSHGMKEFVRESVRNCRVSLATVASRLESVNNCFSDGSICAIESRDERIRARIREEARDIRSTVTRRLKSLCRYFDPQR